MAAVVVTAVNENGVQKVDSPSRAFLLQILIQIELLKKLKPVANTDTDQRHTVRDAEGSLLTEVNWTLF